MNAPTATGSNPETTSGTLTGTDVDRFHRDGFLPYGRVLDDEMLAQAQEAYDQMFTESRERGGARNLVDDSSYRGEHDGGGRMLQIMNCYRRHPLFQRLIYHPTVLAPIKDLIGPHLMLFHDQALYKPAGDGREVFWHQDNGYWQVRPANLVSCWITLDDADADNGAMQFIPGSHLAPVAHERSAEAAALMDIRDQVDESRAVTVPLRAGCCVFHHCQTFHYTDVNRSDRDRRAFIIHAMVPGSRDRHGHEMAAGYEHPVLSSQW